MPSKYVTRYVGRKVLYEVYSVTLYMAAARIASSAWIGKSARISLFDFDTEGD